MKIERLAAFDTEFLKISSIMVTNTKVICTIILLIAANQFNPAVAQRVTRSFDKNWRFRKGDTTGAEQQHFNDQEWRKVSIPHDWSIEGPYASTNPTKSGGGYLPAGIGWYRKTFVLDNSFRNKKISIEFDGVMANSEVWINGHLLGKRPYGYISFNYDITDHVKIGAGTANVITVKADNSIQPASRYYTGAGIYRHVRMNATNPVHFNHWGIFVTTPVVDKKSAVVIIKSQVVNESTSAKQYIIVTKIIDPIGKTIQSTSSGKTVNPGKAVDVEQELQVSNPHLWDFENPVLYKAVTKILDGKNLVDAQVTPFGIRSIRFDAATGFWINDKNVKLKGVCLHHDGGAVGAAVPASIWHRRLMSLKQIGVNAIRTSHNPVAPEFLDLCDQLGLAVMDESFDTWTAAKPGGEKGYNLYFTNWWDKDTRDMILRDRNHPSIVIYSVGNEIHDNLNSPEGFKKYKDQQDLIHRLDGTRPVTMALFRPGSSKVYTNGFADMMDVVGQNYRENELVAAHEQHPEWKVIGTENSHAVNAWVPLRDKPYMAGQFLWTGYDYLGEAFWPMVSNGSGLFNRVGELKALGMQRESWWSDKPVLHIVRQEQATGRYRGLAADWTPVTTSSNDSAHIQVYSNSADVELFLNGKSLGQKAKPSDDGPRRWDILFEKGTIKAIGKNNGKVVAQKEYKTSGAPAKVILTSDRSSLLNNWDDVAFIKATIIDADGNVCVNEQRKVQFTISGNAYVDAIDNGNLANHESYQSTSFPIYKGSCVAIVKANGKGKAVISASIDGLTTGKPVEITIK